MLEEGIRAPDFTLHDQNGKQVTLSKLEGKIVVLYFYPKDNTPGCTREACAFRDELNSFKKLDAVVLGVSPDDVKSHKKFTGDFKLTFPLLADPTKAVCEAYGVWKEKILYGRKFMGIERTTILIDSSGVVRKIFRRVRVDGHAGKVLEAIKNL